MTKTPANIPIGRRLWTRTGLLVAVGVLAASIVSPAIAETIGMVADQFTDRVIVFDADTNTVLGSVQIAPGQVIGDCSITSDGSLGFVTNRLQESYVALSSSV